MDDFLDKIKEVLQGVESEAKDLKNTPTSEVTSEVTNEVTKIISEEHEAQKAIVADLTTKLNESMRGRKETEIGLEEEYWRIRNKLSHANVRLEELRSVS